MSTIGSTPLMRQYHEIKKQYPGTLLLFQVGDFYELFHEDAQKASAFLAITLTQRGYSDGEPIPLCGVPRHVIDHYLIKLVRGGFRVALCDQLEEAQPGKVVERGVTNVFTPGTLTDVTLLDEKSATYLAVVAPVQDAYGIFFIEILTGQFFATMVMQTHEKLLEAELGRFLPHEIVLPMHSLGIRCEKELRAAGYVTTMIDDVTSQALQARSWLVSRMSQDGLSFIEHSPALLQALTMLYAYLDKNQRTALDACKQGFLYNPEDFLILDAATQRNLEIVKNSYDDTVSHTLLSVMDQAITSMGSRTIKKWLLRPLAHKSDIEKRLDKVDFFIKNYEKRSALRALFREVGDLERIVGRIALRRAQLQDYRALGAALLLLPQIAFIVHHIMDDFTELYALLASAINDDMTRDWIIKTGYHAELDRLRYLTDQGTQAIVELEKREQQATGISSLKIRYNTMHGYAIEITKIHLDLVPSHYIRVQTLTHRERFTTVELKDLEYELQHARSTCKELEQQLFKQVCASVEPFLPALKRAITILAASDALAAFAEAAVVYRYVRPTMLDQGDMHIVRGRHPVVEARMIGSPEQFIPNDTLLNNDQRIWIITGPNMGGKSTYLRQVALICLLAQCGSFVPADAAQLPIVDRIFTRIGAADRVALGKSTFLVEMEETALICHQATEKSLVILDEVGRGTSTYDGLAIAQAVVEYLYTEVKARALFATHYHELSILTQQYSGIVNYHAASKQTPEGVLLLHTIQPGIAEGSFGIAVAKSARLPEKIIVRAQQILASLT